MGLPPWPQDDIDWIIENWETLKLGTSSLKEVAQRLIDELGLDKTKDAVHMKLRRMIDSGDLAPYAADVQKRPPGKPKKETYGQAYEEIRPEGSARVRLENQTSGITKVVTEETPSIRNFEMLMAAAEMSTDIFEEAKPTQIGVHEMGYKTIDWDGVIEILEMVQQGNISIQKAVPLLKTKSTAEKINLWTVKSWVRRKASPEMLSDLAKAVLDDVRETAIRRKPNPTIAPKTGLVTVPAAFDAHLGMLAWGDEVGENNDLRRGSFALDWIWSELVRRLEFFTPERWLLIIGQDLMHFDSISNETSRGTRVDSDSRHPKVYKEAVKCCINQIERCRATAPVTILILPGNHAWMSELTIGLLLEAKYDAYDDVEIDASSAVRKYFEWGDVMIGTTHGHLERIDMQNIVTAEMPEMWGRTWWREMLTGHLHNRQTKSGLRKVDKMIDEVQGIILRQIPAVVPLDYYHSAGGWVGSRRGAEGLVYSRDHIEHTVHLPIRQGKMPKLYEEARKNGLV